MRKNQITISVVELIGKTPLEYSVYCDSNNFYEALIGATQAVIQEREKRLPIPEFGDKSITYKTPLSTYRGTPIVYGDVLLATDDVIVHQVNCMGKMNSGIARQVREKFPKVYHEYLKACEKYEDKEQLLGKVQAVKLDDNRTICNLFAQLNFGYDGKRYTNIEAFARCLESINTRYAGKRVAVPFNIGCCRGGANWDDIFALISRKLCDCKITLYKYNE